TLAIGLGMLAPATLVVAADEYSAVEAIFAKHCLDCHAATEPEGKLVLESFEALSKGGENGPAVKAGHSADSLLIQMVEGTVERDGKRKIMPPGKRPKLSPEEIAALKAWVDAGAPAPKDPARLAIRELVTPHIAPLGPPRRAIHAIAHAPGPK